MTAKDSVVSDAIRFGIAGGINTALTALVYFASLLVVRSEIAYLIAWLAGLAFVAAFYPEKVFPGGRTGVWDRLMVVSAIVVTFLLGSISLHYLRYALEKPVVAFLLTLAITTCLNFLISRWVLRKP